jgi:hypothetical protein
MGSGGAAWKLSRCGMQAGPGKVENMDGMNCYAVATLFAEPGKTRKNPAKSMDFPREVASVVS